MSSVYEWRSMVETDGIHTQKLNRYAKNRLLAIAAKLDEVKRSQFDMGKFAGEEWEGKPNLSCGTAACAAGWATTIPSIRRRGLYLELLDDGCEPFIVFKGNRGFTACAQCFEIDIEDTEVLFNIHEGHETPRQVAGNIRWWVKQFDENGDINREISTHARQEPYG